MVVEEGPIQDIENRFTLLTTVVDLNDYDGASIESKMESFVASHGVVMFSKTFCPFSLDAKDLLTQSIGTPTYVIEIDTHPDGAAIHKVLKDKTKHKTVPLIFIRGKFVGGCDELKSLHSKNELEPLLRDLIVQKKVQHATSLKTTHLVPAWRGTAMKAPLWFPSTVNNYVVRLTGLQVFTLSVLSAVFYDDDAGGWIAAALLVDFTLRMCVGASLSPLGMISQAIAAPFKPKFRPGPPKQFAAFCGLFFSLVATIFYFTGVEIAGLIVILMLAGASGLEAFFDFCLGCEFFAIGIQLGLLPSNAYRIYTTTRQETVNSWDYMFTNSNAPAPQVIVTDPSDPVALKYKKKTDEWTKDDFHLIRNMQVSYFGMPLSLAGLAVAFKVASEFGLPANEGAIIIKEEWFQAISVVAAVVFGIMIALYMLRAVMHPHKVVTEWDCPLRSPSFGLISITFMLFAFILFDQIDYTLSTNNANKDEEDAPQIIARVSFWIGAVAHVAITVMKFGEWVGRRLELEHVHSTWMILPVGLAAAALVAPVVPMFEESKNGDGNEMLARFFFSFALLMWVTLFVITFFKTTTTHNSDPRIRHSVSIWVAAPCMLGMADLSICLSGTSSALECQGSFANYYFIGLILFLSLLWAAMPHIRFFGTDKFGMAYWTHCFSLDTLAACAAFFYRINDFRASRTLMVTLLGVAAGANLVAFLHTMACLIRRRGVFTPEGKWGPLSFMKLTHEAFRGVLPKLLVALESIELGDSEDQNLGVFAALFNHFCILHHEHSQHEDKYIFKLFNDYFPEHAKKYNDDHQEDHEKLEAWCQAANTLLNKGFNMPARADALAKLQRELPLFFEHFLEHLQGEEDNLNPVGRKYIPLDLQKQVSRACFEITSAEHWEIMIPFVVNNVPRHVQRTRYLRCLLWSMPERAQQIGAIVYRNVDAVMWERLRFDVPEIIPRGAPNWKRYY